MLCDVGHYESEVHVKDAIARYLKERLSGLAVRCTEVCTNPVPVLFLMHLEMLMVSVFLI